MFEGLYFRYDVASANEEIREIIDRIKDKAAVHAIIGLTLYDQTIERFENEEDPSGNTWEGLHPITLSNRRNAAGILRDTGELFRSIHYKSSASQAEVGTNLNHPKVWVMQHGADIKPRRVPNLRIPYGDGYVFSKGVTIPARPYIGIGSKDEEVLREELVAYLEG